MNISQDNTVKFFLSTEDGTIIYAHPMLPQEDFPVGSPIFAMPDQGEQELDTTLVIKDEQHGVFDLYRLDNRYFKGIIGILRKDRVRENAIGQLEEEHRDLKAIFESSHDGIVVADGTGLFVRINNSYQQITGIAKENIIGSTAAEIVKKGIVSDSGTLEVLKTGQPYTIHQTFRSGRQSVVTSTPIFDENNNIFRVVTNVRDMTEINRLREELAQSKEKLDEYTKILETLTAEQKLAHSLVFRSRKMSIVTDAALKFAKVDAPLLIGGESGVGKEVIADLVYKNSSRSNARFLKINCGAIPENLLESELFGYVGGAFTGAKRDGVAGLFETAHGGTVLLDEIGELPLALQVKLLRFVQQREFYRVGGKKLIQVDVRIIAATNRDLQEMVSQKLFRSDLFYRLNVLKITIPPLRERAEDIIPLANFFLEKYNKKYSLKKRISGEVYRILTNHTWVGNVRELENVVERLVVVCERDEITAEYLPEELRKTVAGAPPVIIPGESSQKTYKEAKEEFEKEFFRQAITKYKTSRRVAEQLAVDHSTVVKKAAKYELSLSQKPG